jgi:lysophospholipase L1-like esterase
LKKGGGILLRIKFLLLSVFAILLIAKTQNINFSTYRTGSDTIINKQHLSPFFNKLSNLEKSDSTHVLNILHIGDSHIQADFLTREIRYSLQKRFGNAGRGLVFPYRLTKSNESYDFRTSSGNSWKWETVRMRKRQFEPGIAGASLLSTDNIFNVELKMNKRDSVDNSFSKLKLICRNDSNGLLAFVTTKNDSTRKLLAFSGDTIYETKLECLSENVSLQSNGNLLIDGLVLENESKGIQCHVVGINGAHYADYNHSPVFFVEMPLLQPDVIFVSLGTNEGVNSRVSEQAVMVEVDAMVRNVRSQGVDAPIVIITPFDNFYRRKKFNPYLKVVRNGLIAAAEKNNIACMDMYYISGGYGSAAEWRRRGLITADRIHYTVQGYTLQGKMIYNTLINSYSKYVAR